jgi:hypothetical protein
VLFKSQYHYSGIYNIPLPSFLLSSPHFSILCFRFFFSSFSSFFFKLLCLRNIAGVTINTIPFLNQPVIDGVDIPDAPLIVINQGQFNRRIASVLLGKWNQILFGPLLLLIPLPPLPFSLSLSLSPSLSPSLTQMSVYQGNNLVEGNLFAWLYAGLQLSINETQYQEIVNQYVLPQVSTEQLNAVYNLYENTTVESGYWEAIRSECFPCSTNSASLSSPLTFLTFYSEMTGDAFVNCGTEALSLAFSGYQFDNLTSLPSLPPFTPIPNVYRYVFTHSPQNGSNAFLNATHASEVAFVFQANIYGIYLNPDEIAFSQSLIDYWTSFHINENPNKGVSSGSGSMDTSTGQTSSFSLSGSSSLFSIHPFSSFFLYLL